MVKESFPTLHQVWGTKWVQKNKDWLDDLVQCRLPWFYQLESDLLGLQEYAGLNELVRCFRSALRDKTQIQQAIYEVHGCHLMASVAGNIRLHVPLQDDRGVNFDFQVNILGDSISGDVKTREDRFPFNFPPVRDENGIEMFGGTRATLDPHEARRLNIPEQRNPEDRTHHGDTPESTVIKKLLERALEQLPLIGRTLVILGQIVGHSDAECDLEDSLFGTEALGYKKSRGKLESFRYPTGVFLDLPEYVKFNRLSAVLSIRLSRLSGSEMARAYRFYSNPAANKPISDAVSEAIVGTFHHWESASRKPE